MPSVRFAQPHIARAHSSVSVAGGAGGFVYVPCGRSRQSVASGGVGFVDGGA
jgi:hypothetical protein